MSKTTTPFAFILELRFLPLSPRRTHFRPFHRCWFTWFTILGTLTLRVSSFTETRQLSVLMHSFMFTIRTCKCVSNSYFSVHFNFPVIFDLPFLSWGLVERWGTSMKLHLWTVTTTWWFLAITKVLLACKCLWHTKNPFNYNALTDAG